VLSHCRSVHCYTASGDPALFTPRRDRRIRVGSAAGAECSRSTERTVGAPAVVGGLAGTEWQDARSMLRALRRRLPRSDLL